MCAEPVEIKALWANGCSSWNYSARANEQWLVSERLLKERQGLIESLQEDKQKLRLNPKREAGLQKGKTSPVQQQSLVHVCERASVKQPDGPIGKLQSVLDVESDEHSGESEDEGHNASQVQGPRQRDPQRLVQPLGFKEVRSRVGKFSGKKGDEDFGLWLADFQEATDDFSWSNDTRAKWFSWFVEGPAKATWQRTLSAEERGSWLSIKKVFQGQYGTHMDPRTAYLRCHELQYEELGSVQALLEAMREYQRLAPEKLSDANLESILWNKVPVALQKEVGEIKEWPLQECFQRLLKEKPELKNEKGDCSRRDPSSLLTHGQVEKQGERCQRVGRDYLCRQEVDLINKKATQQHQLKARISHLQRCRQGALNASTVMKRATLPAHVPNLRKAHLE